ncbi:MAG TPA: vWA domain-containing protein, partial [Desulfobacterales bacterium]|nr:vWA domain-containing protein [Desulfobacterales bacterium]
MKRYVLVTLLAIFGCTPNLWADDTEIYGTVNNPSLEPNVMILFDTSGSMATEDVPGEPYEPSQTYTCGSCSYSANAVYYRSYNYYTRSYYWSLFASDVGSLACDTIKNNLLNQGYAEGYIRSSGYTCGGSNYYRLRTGNYLNYGISGVGLPQSRISVAQQVLADLIATTDGVRFGMFVFNFDQGGRLVAPCGTDKATLLSRVAGAAPNGWTPLAETLAEVGLYFAGKPSWYNSGTYTSPMQERCQKNYVIIMTDGEPTRDRDSRLYSTPYINGDLIGDQDGDHLAPCAGGGYDQVYNNGYFESVYRNFGTLEYWYRDANGSCKFYTQEGEDYLDDVAQYLYENDCNPSMGDGTSFDKQNIVTFTIGFKTNQSLLQRTAAKGGGEYFTAENYSELKEAFSQIMSSIVEKNACYVAP